MSFYSEDEDYYEDFDDDFDEDGYMEKQQEISYSTKRINESIDELLLINQTEVNKNRPVSELITNKIISLHNEYEYESIDVSYLILNRLRDYLPNTNIENLLRSLYSYQFDKVMKNKVYKSDEDYGYQWTSDFIYTLQSYVTKEIIDTLLKTKNIKYLMFSLEQFLEKINTVERPTYIKLHHHNDNDDDNSGREDYAAFLEYTYWEAVGEGEIDPSTTDWGSELDNDYDDDDYEYNDLESVQKLISSNLYLIKFYADKIIDSKELTNERKQIFVNKYNQAIHNFEKENSQKI